MTVANVNIRRVLLKRGNTAQSTSYTGPIGEVTMDTDIKSIRIHDGVTSGGHLIPTQANMQSYANSAVSSSLAAINANVATLTTTVTTANISMKSYVDAQITSIVGGAPTVLNTLGEIATALNNDANVAATLTNSIAAINSNVANIFVPDLESVSGNVIPSANVTYSLGNVTHQWKDLWVSSNTIYINSIPLSVDEQGILSVNGAPVSSSGNIDVVSVPATGTRITGVRHWDSAGANLYIWFDASDTTELVDLGGYGDITGWTVTDSDGNSATVTATNPAGYFSISTDQALTGSGTLTFTDPNYTEARTSSIRFVASSSGDGNNLSTIEIRPDSGATQDQYLVIDPTAPNHIHIRAGGTQDQSNSQLFLGGENTHVVVSDDASIVRMKNQSTQLDNSFNLAAGQDYSTAEWVAENGSNFLRFNDVTQPVLDAIWAMNSISTIEIYTGSDYHTFTGYYGSSTPGLGQQATIYIDQVPSVSPTSVINAYFQINQVRETYVEVDGSDIRIEAGDDIRMYSRDVFRLYNYSSTDPIEIVTNYNNNGQTWEFGVDGTLTAPGDITVGGVITGTIDSSTLYLKALPGSNTYIQLNDTVNSSIRTVADLEIRTDVNNGPQVWRFATNGGLVFPDSTTQTTAWTGTVDYANVNNTPVLANVATSGSYNDLTDIPAIPTAYTDSDVVTLLSAFGSNTISTTGNVSGDVGLFNDINLNNAGTNKLLYTDDNRNIYDTGFSYDAANNAISGSGNITANSFIGDGSQLTGLPASYSDASVTTLLAAFGSNTISTTGNITANSFIGDGSQLTGLPASYSDSDVVTLLSDFGSNTIVTTGNITAGNFVGNISITGNVTGTSANVELVAGSYIWTFDNTGVVTIPAVGGDEGGEINFGIPATNTTLTGPVKVDVYQDRIRLFDGSTKGVYIDLAQAGAGVSTLLNNRVSGYVNAGTYVTMDNLKATVSTSGNRSLEIASVSGSFSAYVNATYTLYIGGTAGTGAGITVTTTPALALNWNFGSAGDTATYIISDTTNSRCYRVTMMIGGGYNSNMISIERLI